jgi:hypothetical protein
VHQIYKLSNHTSVNILQAISPRILDTLLFPIDSVLRLSSITGSLSLLQAHPDPRLSQSLFLQLIIGAVASAGGGVTAATFDVWTPEWKFGTPVILKSNWVGSVDVWGGAVTGTLRLGFPFRRIADSTRPYSFYLRPFNSFSSNTPIPPQVSLDYFPTRTGIYPDRSTSSCHDRIGSYFPVARCGCSLGWQSNPQGSEREDTIDTKYV